MFKQKVFELLNYVKEYNKQNYIKIIIEIYNKEKYNFELSKNKINKAEWKSTTNKFNKYSFFESVNDDNGNLILRKYNYEFIETYKNKERKN